MPRKTVMQGSAYQVDFNNTSASTITLSGKAAGVVLSAKTADCYINFLETASAANGFYLPAGGVVVIPDINPTQISVLATDITGGTLYAIELVE